MPSITRVVKFIRKGDKGDPGQPGKDGKGILSITENYLATSAATGVTVSTVGWTTSVQSVTAAKKYLWNYEKVKYTDGTEQNTQPTIIGVYGETGKGISRVEEYYLATSAASGVTTSTSGWTTSIQTITATKKYLWNFERVYYTDGSMETQTPVIIGVYGDKGDPGQPGTPGSDGNGIQSQTSLFVATNKAAGVTYENTSGWETTFATPTQQLPYIWKCVRTVYTKSGTSYSTPELIAQYQSGANPNLLDNAAFTSNDNMKAWTVISQYSGQTLSDKGTVSTTDKKDGRNSYYDTCKSFGANALKNILEQIVYNTSIKKLTAGQWHTLSFWAKASQRTIYIAQESSNYGFAIKELYLIAGWTYTISVSGYASQDALSAGKYLRTYVYKEGWGESQYVEIKTTSLSTKTMTFTPLSTGKYFLSSFMYDSSEPRTGTVYVSSYSITDHRDLDTYIYPYGIDTSAKWYVDGKEATPAGDGHIQWALSSQWTFHTVTFKAKAYFYSSEESKVLFRLFAPPCADAYRMINICMPKLEIGMVATGFLDTYSDTRGERGPALRGPQAWSDCANGYNFQAGGDIEQWKDAVIYKDNYYSCVKSHTKTAENYPGSTADNNNHYWQLGDKIELVATKILLATYALVKNLGVEAIDMKDANGNILFQAKDGNVIAKTGTFNNIKIQSGQIAGFKISGNGLTNDPFTNDAYIIFRNDSEKCFAGIGGNVLPSSSGMRAVARFENEDTTDQWGLKRNIAMLLSAKGGNYNHAFIGSGNGNLNGWIGGYKYSKYTCSSANTIYSGYANLKENNRWLIACNVDGSGIALPKLTEVREALGIGTSDKFCVEFTVVADLSNSKNISVYGRNNNEDNSKAHPWNTDEMPNLLNNNADHWDSATLGKGDAMTVLLTYDTSIYTTIGGYSAKYTARIINWHQ